MTTSFGNNNNKIQNLSGDFVSFRDNKHVEVEDDDDDDGLDSEVQYETSLGFIPTKKNSRISFTEKRAVSHTGMESLVSLVKQLHVNDNDKNVDGNVEAAAASSSLTKLSVY
mmetsp:Transcript_50537/g.51426  ORF Transcript_50537/g.51426 Transcript_50537/m.51426 type:complete len:112 (-) Transcript_50537:263-598(-)